MKMAVKFSESNQSFDVKIKEANQSFDARFKGIQPVTEYIGGEPYIGEYTIIPKVEAQTMPTKGKVMSDDVTVKKIPYFDVSNNSGGSTVYIGNEVE